VGGPGLAVQAVPIPRTVSVPLQVTKFPACPQDGLSVKPSDGPVQPMPIPSRFATVPHWMFVGYIWLALQLQLDPAPLLAVPLLAVPLVAVPLLAVPLLAVPLVAVPLLAVPLVAVPLLAVPLVAVPLLVVPLLAVPLRAVPLLAASLVLAVPLLLTVPLLAVPLRAPPLPALPVVLGPAVLPVVPAAPEIGSPEMLLDPAVAPAGELPLDPGWADATPPPFEGSPGVTPPSSVGLPVSGASKSTSGNPQAAAQVATQNPTPRPPRMK
jgi:hypothetical protein